MVLFLAADPRELNGLLSCCRDIKELNLPVHWARAGTLHGNKMIAVANGAGAKRAALAVESARTWAGSVCNIGFCGALDQTMAIGDIFIATSVRSNGDEFTTRQPVTLRGCASGVLASIDHVAQTCEEKQHLRQSGAMAVEMEAAGAAAKAAEYGLPFYCVRAVTDLAGETFACDFNAALREDGRFDIMRLLSSALRKPVSRFSELVRMQRRCDLASKNLGEFLATCEF